MLKDFRIFLTGILPQGRGLRALLLCVFLIPLVTDLVLLMLQVKLQENAIYMSGMVVNGYIRYFPWLVVYLLVFFLISYGYKKIIHNK